MKCLKWFKSLANNKLAKTVVLGFAFAPFTTETAQAHGRCYEAQRFESAYAGGSWHLRAKVGVPRPTPDLKYWHVHGPVGVNAQLWPESVQSGVVYVYFSYPAILNPYASFGLYQFRACTN